LQLTDSLVIISFQISYKIDNLILDLFLAHQATKHNFAKLLKLQIFCGN
jgi:hypothetical protein